MSVFDRCGLASLEDLYSPEAQQLMAELESWQQRLLACENQFRSKQYPWPRAPLYQWSRTWEYPYVFAQILKFHTTYSSTTKPRIVDLGSGVTFFPFVVASKGFDITAIDNDPCGQMDYPRATRALNLPDGTIEFRLADATGLPLADHSVDIVYCISVLEHLPNPTVVVGEVHRVLKTGGLFIVTMDLTMDLAARHALTPEQYRAIRSTIDELFDATESENTVHPAVVLTEANSPYRPPIKKSIKGTASAIKRRLRTLLKQQTIQFPQRTVFGYVGVSRK